MEITRTIKKLLLGLAAVTAISATAQDKLAMQAPTDKTLKSIEALKLQKSLAYEDLDMPASQLYTTWETERVHYYPNAIIPDSFRIDLSGYYMPTESRKITSNYGYRRGRMHKGLDVKVYIGDTIRSAFDGKVRIVQYERRGYGKYVVIRHPNGLETVG